MSRMTDTLFPVNYMDNLYGDSIGLFYIPEWNAFQDEDGFLVYSIFEIISPSDLFLFKRNKEYMCVPHRTMPEILVELFYQEADDGDHY